MFDDMIFFRAHERYKNEEELNQRDYLKQYFTVLNESYFHAYAMQIGNKFVGYVCAVYIPKIGKRENNGFMFVDDLWVNPDYRKMGVAKNLMDKIENIAIEKGYYGLRLYVAADNNAGVSLYKKCGYDNKQYGKSMFMEKIL